MLRLSSAVVALAAAALFTTALAVNTTPSSGFVASDGSVTFALNIPQNDQNQGLYFVLQGPSSSSWIAVGMGNNKMENSLMFLAYADSTGNNVTLSPRLSYGHTEPSYSSNITVSVLPGSGIANGKMTVNAMCANCRSWKGGSIDPTNTDAQFIFASGPSGALDSNSLSASINRHSSYGSFAMDLTKAVGIAGVPVAATADSSGTTQESIKTDNDFSGPLHAALMIISFVVIMPLGIVLLRVYSSVKWHGLNQFISAAVALIGAFVGVYCATMYNRTKNYNNVHQIFGLVIIVAMIAQFVLGYMHHRIFKRTLSTTKLAPIHVWLGRLVIPCGIANGFLGFPLALNSKYNWALLAILLLVILIGGPFSYWRWKRNNRRKEALASGEGFESSGYNSQAWTANQSRTDIHLDPMDYAPPSYERPQHAQGREFV